MQTYSSPLIKRLVHDSMALHLHSMVNTEKIFLDIKGWFNYFLQPAALFIYLKLNLNTY